MEGDRMRWPTDDNRVSSAYGPRAPLPYHHGADFPYPISGKLYAILDYEVVWAGWRPLGGWTAALRFPDGTVGWYQHMAKPATITGKGREGDVVGVMGTTGLLTTGIHLHFELRRPDGTSFDPIPYLRAGSTASTPDAKPLPIPVPVTPEEEDDNMNKVGFIWLNQAGHPITWALIGATVPPAGVATTTRQETANAWALIFGTATGVSKTEWDVAVAEARALNTAWVAQQKTI